MRLEYQLITETDRGTKGLLVEPAWSDGMCWLLVDADEREGRVEAVGATKGTIKTNVGAVKAEVCTPTVKRGRVPSVQVFSDMCTRVPVGRVHPVFGIVDHYGVVGAVGGDGHT